MEEKPGSCWQANKT